MMKNWLIYIIAVSAAVLFVACEKTEADGYAAGEGGVVMSLTQTRAEEDSGWTPKPTLDGCTIFIYQKGTNDETSEPTETLIRKYAHGKCPETIKLLAGNYFAKVEWGERPAAAAFDKCFYEGSAGFTIEAGKTSEVTVPCKPQSTAVEVVFNKTITDLIENKKFTDCAAVVALPDDTKLENALTFTKSETGYFTMPEDVTKLTWSFGATHSEKGAFSKSGEITGVEAGKKYTLTFKYSPDLPGYISVDIDIDETTTDLNDVMIFSEDPGIDLEEQQDFTSETLPEEIVVTMKATAEKATVEKAFIYLDGENTASPASTRADNDPPAYWSWTEESGASDPTIATASLSGDKKELTIKFLSQKVLSANGTCEIEAGKTNYRFEVVDSNQSKADKTMTLCIEGLCPIREADYDLWTNDITLHAISSHGKPTFKLQWIGSTSEWAPTKIEKTAENEYTATFASEWVPEPEDYEKNPEDYNNKAGIKVYRPKEGLGIFADNSYTASVVIGGTTYDATFTPTVDQPIPNSDMSDTSCSCFGTDNKTTEFWGSGNNKYAPELCAPEPKSGRSCAHLKSTMAGVKIGIIEYTMLASGNLFTGTFVRPSTEGTVSFGQNYEWKARPTALQLKYHATIGKVNQQKHEKKDEDGNKIGHPANIGDQDKAIVYVAIVAWNKQHEVKSGTSGCSGTWSPDEKAVRDEGPIIGYGIFEIDTSTEGSELVDKEIPIYYYDKTTKPSGAYTLVISCATNIYGDYMCGCDSNELWVTDFEWVY